MRNPKGIKQALDVYMQREFPHRLEAETGLVQAVTASGVSVRVSGSTNTQDARVVKGQSPQPGETVLLVRVEGDRQWTVFGTLAAVEDQRNTGGEVQEKFLAPPINIRQGPPIPGCVTLTWDAPYQLPVAFDVMATADMLSIPEEVSLTTRGSYVILSSSESLYLRVRSVSSEGLYSGWSQWYKVYPTSSQVNLDNVLTYYGQVITYNGNILTYDPPVS